jgi:hypothetical protein
MKVKPKKLRKAEGFTKQSSGREYTIVMTEASGNEQSVVPWPMSNEELRQWFSRENISLDELTRMWIRMDQNERTKTEIQTLKGAGDIKELEKRLRQRIQFGTAGKNSLVLHLWSRPSRTHGSRLLAHE